MAEGEIGTEILTKMNQDVKSGDPNKKTPDNLGSIKRVMDAESRRLHALIPEDTSRTLPSGWGEPKLLTTTGTSAQVSELDINGKPYVLKELRRKSSRKHMGVPDYESVTREEYIMHLNIKVKEMQEENAFMQEIFGSLIEPSSIQIIDSTEAGPDGENIPVIAEIQGKVDGENISRPKLDENGKIQFTYRRNNGNPEAHEKERETNPNYEKTRKQMETLYERLNWLSEMIKSGDLSQLSPESQRFMNRLMSDQLQVGIVRMGGLPLDIHRGGNLMVDKSGNVRIIDW